MVFKKGNKPWNLGLTKEKDSRVKRNAENSSKTKKEKFQNRIRYCKLCKK